VRVLALQHAERLEEHLAQHALPPHPPPACVIN
jgi:hypothetical protein